MYTFGQFWTKILKNGYCDLLMWEPELTFTQSKSWVLSHYNNQKFLSIRDFCTNLIIIAKEPESQENATLISNFLFGIVLFRSKFCYKSRGLRNSSRISDGISLKKNPAGFTY